MISIFVRSKFTNARCLLFSNIILWIQILISKTLNHVLRQSFDLVSAFVIQWPAETPSIKCVRTLFSIYWEFCKDPSLVTQRLISRLRTNLLYLYNMARYNIPYSLFVSTTLCVRTAKLWTDWYKKIFYRE